VISSDSSIRSESRTIEPFVHPDGYCWIWDGHMPRRIDQHLRQESIRKRRQRRRHSYSAERLGLTSKDLSEHFEDYEALFLSR
jgi:hypothetical protein